MKPATVRGLEGQAALVTGGAKRIGKGICMMLAHAGCHVAIHYSTSDEDAKALADDLRGHVVDVVTVHADLADANAAEGLVAAASEALGHPIDLVVNNASSFPKQDWQTASYEDLDAMMRIHAWAPLAIMRAAAAQGAHAAVNLLDTRIVADDPEHAPYLLSKQALWHLNQDMARTLAPMRVNGVAPGPILPPTGGDDAELEAARKATVLRRIGSVEGITHAVRFLLENEYVTGDTVFVDGGRHLHD